MPISVSYTHLRGGSIHENGVVALAAIDGNMAYLDRPAQCFMRVIKRGLERLAPIEMCIRDSRY